MATSLERSQLHFTVIIYARKSTNAENFAKIGGVLSEIGLIGLEPEAVSALMVIQGHQKWCHSTDHVQLPIRLRKQLYVYLIPFRRYSLPRNKVWIE